MPRLTCNLFKLGAIDVTPMKKKTSHYPNYPYKQMLPAALRDRVSGRGEKQRKVPCLQEMSLMLACLKKKEFDESRCSKEIELFIACSKEQNEMNLNKKQLDVEVIKESGRLPSEIVNTALGRYPQSKKKT